VHLLLCNCLAKISDAADKIIHGKKAALIYERVAGQEK